MAAFIATEKKKNTSQKYYEAVPLSGIAYIEFSTMQRKQK